VVVAELSARETHQTALRMHLIQVLLNYRTMQGGGYVFALWPWLRRQPHRGSQVPAVGSYINSHPVFASFAIGAMRKRLEQGDLAHDAEDFAQWRESLAGPLGVTGDALIWDRWKPLLFAAGALVLLISPSVSAWAIVAMASLLLYNVPLYFLRVWGVRQGYRLGSGVLEILRDPRFASARRVMTFAGIWLAGALTMLGLWVTAQGSLGRGAQFLAAYVVMWLGLRFRLSASTAVLFAVVAALMIPGIR
jgi:mannose/fructose/N-acetylgalactosamine-specific phosphotransferase system component IID